MSGSQKARGRLFTSREAKAFLISKIVHEAELDGVPLAEVERKMLYFSELYEPLPDLYDTNDEFEDHYDRREYEGKIADLIRRAYQRDRKEFPEDVRRWWAAIHVLDREDHYILVMLNQAGLRPPGDLQRLILTATGIVVALLVGIYLSVRLAVPESWESVFSLLFLAAVVLAWMLVSPSRRKMLGAFAGGPFGPILARGRPRLRKHR